MAANTQQFMNHPAFQRTRRQLIDAGYPEQVAEQAAANFMALTPEQMKQEAEVRRAFSTAGVVTIDEATLKNIMSGASSTAEVVRDEVDKLRPVIQRSAQGTRIVGYAGILLLLLSVLGLGWYLGRREPPATALYKLAYDEKTHQPVMKDGFPVPYEASPDEVAYDTHQSAFHYPDGYKKAQLVDAAQLERKYPGISKKYNLRWPSWPVDFVFEKKPAVVAQAEQQPAAERQPLAQQATCPSEMDISRKSLDDIRALIPPANLPALPPTSPDHAAAAPANVQIDEDSLATKVADKVRALSGGGGPTANQIADACVEAARGQFRCAAPDLSDVQHWINQGSNACIDAVRQKRFCTVNAINAEGSTLIEHK